MKEIDKLIDATCPECRGPLTEVRNGNLSEYHCLVGHVYTARTMLASHQETEERVLWSAVVALEEAPKLVEAIAPEFPPEIAERLKRQAEKKFKQAQCIREVLQDLDPFQLE